VGGFDRPHSFDLSIGKAKICGSQPFNKSPLVLDALSERFLCVVLVNLDLTARKGTWAFFLVSAMPPAQKVKRGVSAPGRTDDPINLADAEG
jgi:hypothetical protein